MALALAQLIAPTALTTASQRLFIAGALTRIDKLTMTNSTGSAATATVYIVSASSSTPTTFNIITNAFSVAAGATFNCPDVVGHILKAGDYLLASSGTASALNIMASGVTQT